MAKEVTEIMIDLTTVIVEQRVEIKRYKERIEELTELNNKLFAQIKEKEQHLEVGMSYEDMESALLATQEENNELQKQCEEKDATITDLRTRLEKLELELAELRSQPQSDPFPEDSPSGEVASAEPTDCIYYSEGDEVAVSGLFFAEPNNRYIGVVIDVMRDNARVAIQGGDMDGEEYEIPYHMIEYLTTE